MTEDIKPYKQSIFVRKTLHGIYYLSKLYDRVEGHGGGG